jgi:hypothetical protein
MGGADLPEFAARSVKFSYSIMLQHFSRKIA